MDAVKSKKCLEVLNELLSESVPNRYYSLNGYGEEAICLEQTDDAWTVYNGERGQKFDEKTFDNVVEAAIEIIYRFRRYSPELKQDFLNRIIL